MFVLCVCASSIHRIVAVVVIFSRNTRTCRVRRVVVAAAVEVAVAEVAAAVAIAAELVVAAIINIRAPVRLVSQACRP